MLCEWCRRPVRWWQSRRQVQGGQWPVMHTRCALMAVRVRGRAGWDESLARLIEDGK